MTNIIKNDYHLHSAFSGDCDTPMEDMIQKGIALGMDNICFTDHHDANFPYEKISFELDFEKYYQKLTFLKEKYKNQINVRMGVELGIQKHLYHEYDKLTTSYPFDFVLCSNHLANGVDPYDPIFFENRTKKEAYADYFKDILTHAKNFSSFDSYGHLDYVIRYGPYEDKTYQYESYKDILDEVLTTLINKGKGIELNASGFFRFENNPHPRVEVLKRYKELGGEILTIGSDAHNTTNLQYKFNLAHQILQNIGFKYYTIFIQRKPKFIKL